MFRDNFDPKIRIILAVCAVAAALLLVLSSSALVS